MNFSNIILKYNKLLSKYDVYFDETLNQFVHKNINIIQYKIM
jgi:hypothetical protein